MNDTAKPMQSRAYYEHIGHLGGNACKVRYGGTGHFAVIGAIGGKTTKERRGPEYYSAIGRLGAHVKYGRWLEAKKAEAAL
jgi:hypothetical protein